jgi:hypothetical protein
MRPNREEGFLRGLRLQQRPAKVHKVGQGGNAYYRESVGVVWMGTTVQGFREEALPVTSYLFSYN